MGIKQVFYVIFKTFFWSWNLTFLLIAYLAILPVIGVILITATIDGIIPLHISLTIAPTIAVPTVSTVIGARRFRKQPLQLMRWFYGVEAPLFLLCLLRLFLLRELTPASYQIIATIALCIAAFLVEMLYGYLGKKENVQNISDSQTSHNKQPRFFRLIGEKRSAWLQLGCHSLMLVVGIWAAALLMYYAVPVAFYTLYGFFIVVIAFFQFTWVSAFLDIIYGWIWGLIWIPLGVILFGLTCSLFVVMPLLYGFLYIHSGRKIWQSFAAQYGKSKALIGSLGVIAAWLAIFSALEQQPQVAALKMLATPPANDTVRQTLLAKSDMIRSGLVNAYLSPYRYLSTVGENNHIYQIYKNTLNLPDGAAQTVQNSYNFLMSPFLYQGSSADEKKAEKLYGEFFDTGLQKGDTEAVKHAVQSTLYRKEAKAGLLNVNQEKVWLQSQEVTVKENGDWADVQLYEVYKNQTPKFQEVFYYFSLPESAAVTGVWLGNTGDLNKRFVFTVSPRGAAQPVYYNQQVVERVEPDPAFLEQNALLEQLGPKQYRLRAFSIPAKREFIQTEGPTEKHLWLTYKVM
ncbi:MAG: TIGR02921 family PEP-CTERM protein, partial [Microcoleus sp. T1-bin1]|nr:TIGR02921 family PEP-CTERM protein [Microcoleus sp. T1-bin1]